MASANLDLVRSIHAEWGRGDFNLTPQWADAEIELVVVGGPEPNSRRGLAANAPGVEDFLNLWENLRFEAEEYRELDQGRVLVVSRMTGRGRGSGVEVDQPRASLFQVRDGRVVRLVFYWDRERALADLGLAQEDAADRPD